MRAIYKGKVFYANDAFDGLHFMEKVTSGNLEYAVTGEGVEPGSLLALIGHRTWIARSPRLPLCSRQGGQEHTPM